MYTDILIMRKKTINNIKQLKERILLRGLFKNNVDVCSQMLSGTRIALA